MGRIIPARAGFTRFRAISGGGRPDHPRSRGVYFSAKMQGLASDGSSPLARGLLVPDLHHLVARRIIPARAGFTVPGHARRGRRRDHPRSRGVYTFSICFCSARRGSSPLARGLPDVAPGPGGPAVDHPRSRGVYQGGRPHRLPMVGSSPLARGLPSPLGGYQYLLGIIPARAGFT